MVMSVTERTREIGVRLAIGARRREVLRQFLFEAAMLAGAGGLAGVVAATGLGLIATALAPGFPAVPPLWAVVSGLVTSIAVGVIAGYWPARRPRRSTRSRRCGTSEAHLSALAASRVRRLLMILAIRQT